MVAEGPVCTIMNNPVTKESIKVIKCDHLIWDQISFWTVCKTSNIWQIVYTVLIVTVLVPDKDTIAKDRFSLDPQHQSIIERYETITKPPGGARQNKGTSIYHMWILEGYQKRTFQVANCLLLPTCFVSLMLKTVLIWCWKSYAWWSQSFPFASLLKGTDNISKSLYSQHYQLCTCRLFWCLEDSYLLAYRHTALLGAKRDFEVWSQLWTYGYETSMRI